MQKEKQFSNQLSVFSVVGFFRKKTQHTNWLKTIKLNS